MERVFRLWTGISNKGGRVSRPGEHSTTPAHRAIALFLVYLRTVFRYLLLVSLIPQGALKMSNVTVGSRKRAFSWSN